MRFNMVRHAFHLTDTPVKPKRDRTEFPISSHLRVKSSLEKRRWYALNLQACRSSPARPSFSSLNLSPNFSLNISRRPQMTEIWLTSNLQFAPEDIRKFMWMYLNTRGQLLRIYHARYSKLFVWKFSLFLTKQSSSYVFPEKQRHDCSFQGWRLMLMIQHDQISSKLRGREWPRIITLSYDVPIFSIV